MHENMYKPDLHLRSLGDDFSKSRHDTVTLLGPAALGLTSGMPNDELAKGFCSAVSALIPPRASPNRFLDMMPLRFVRALAGVFASFCVFFASSCTFSQLCFCPFEVHLFVLVNEVPTIAQLREIFFVHEVFRPSISFLGSICSR